MSLLEFRGFISIAVLAVRISDLWTKASFALLEEEVCSALDSTRTLKRSTLRYRKLASITRKQSLRH